MKYARKQYQMYRRLAILAGLFVASSPSLMAARVMVLWDRNPEADIAGYRVHYGTSSRDYLTIVNAGNTTNAIIDNLTAGTTYYFAVTAYNTSQLESDYSNELVHNVGTGSGSNAAPVVLIFANVTAQKETPTQANNFRVEDPDGASDTMTLGLRVNRGTLAVASNIPNGIAGNQITGNNSAQVQVQASLAAINTTLSQGSGLTYRGLPNLVGADSLTITITDGGRQGQFTVRSDSKSIQIQVMGDAWDTWRNQRFPLADLIDPTKEATVYGDNADPELDGVDNLMEFALGLEPSESDTLSASVQSSILVQDNARYGALTFLRRKNQTAVQYLPEVSADKTTWANGAGAVQLVSQTNVDTEFERVTYQDLTATDPGQARFMRLTIRRNN